MKIPDFDNKQIKQYKNSISFKEYAYYIELPWNKDKLILVPSNYAVALKVLDRIVKNLEKKNLLDNYLTVFCFFMYRKRCN